MLAFVGPSVASVSRRTLPRLRHLATWRCAEPIVIFESDDWGMERHDCSAFLRRYGEPGNWAHEELETPEDMTYLYELLNQHVDVNGRPACFTANFVVANPDYDTIARSHFQDYAELPISHMDDLKSIWLEGVARRVFFPQYHARAHFWPQRWLGDLIGAVPGSRELFDHRCHGGLSLIKGQGWRYHSEYMDWNSGHYLSSQDLTAWLKGGLRIFEHVFCNVSLSTIPPHYICTPIQLSTWKQLGVRFVQGAGYRILRQRNGSALVLAHVLGEHSRQGLLFLSRNVKFEPHQHKTANGSLGTVLREMISHFRNRIPVVIDTHRINYTGHWRGDAIRELGQLLAALRPFRPRFLTTVELGQAIAEGGRYKDVWTGEVRSLSVLDGTSRHMLRAWLSRYNQYLLKKYTFDNETGTT